MRPHALRNALVGVVYLCVLAGLIALSVAVYNHAFTDYTRVALKTDSVGSSLQKGSDVKVRGVFIGDVEDVTTDGTGGATIHLALDPGQAAALPANVTAQLLPKTMFGERYVSLLLPAQPGGGQLRSGATIQQDRSRVSVELEKLFADMLPMLQAVQPQKLSATFGEMAAALRGPIAGDVAHALDVVGKYFNELAPQIPQMTDDFKNFARVARTYTQAAPDLVDSMYTFSTVSQTLLRQQQDYKGLLASLTTMGSTIDNFVTNSQSDIIGLSVNSVPSLQITARYSDEFPCLTRALVNYIPLAKKAFGVGTAHPGGRVVLHVIPRVGPYTAANAPAGYTDDSGPRCPYSATTSLASTALAAVPGVSGANHPGRPAPAGIGTANSPEENALIAELEAPTAGIAPSAYPRWASLLLGPALRGTEVTLR